MVESCKVVCSWCKSDIATGRKLTKEEYKETTRKESGVSHGLCSLCLTKQLIELDKSKENLEKALAKSAEDKQIAESMRDYWRHLNSGAER
jgi:hypothetical protein